MIKGSRPIPSLPHPGAGEESPDNSEHCTSEKEDVREGMGPEKKTTSSDYWQVFLPTVAG